MRESDESTRSLSRTILRTPILYDDDSVVAVDKPAGLLTAPSHFDPPDYTLAEEMAKRLQREHRLAPQAKLLVVHQVDKGESGVVLFAKDEGTLDALSRMLAEGQVSKTYCAIAHGEIANDAGCIDLPIGLRPGDRARMAVRRRKGRASQTEFAVIERFVFYTYLRLNTLTHLRHQVRVHLSALGHPIVGDDVYGDGKGILLSDLKRTYRSKPEQREQPLVGRVALHGAQVRFPHPRTGRQVVIDAETPRDFRATLHNLRRFMGT